jgi:hypothetical protein
MKLITAIIPNCGKLIGVFTKTNKHKEKSKIRDKMDSQRKA